MPSIPTAVRTNHRALTGVMQQALKQQSDPSTSVRAEANAKCGQMHAYQQLGEVHGPVSHGLSTQSRSDVESGGDGGGSDRPLIDMVQTLPPISCQTRKPAGNTGNRLMTAVKTTAEHREGQKTEKLKSKEGSQEVPDYKSHPGISLTQQIHVFFPSPAARGLPSISSSSTSPAMSAAFKDIAIGDRPDWAIQLFECGAVDQCCYAWWCPQCAMAQARSNLDGTDCAFNYCYGGPCPVRWMIRTAYGIQGSAEEDLCVVWCCACCAINQMLQTTNALGDPFGAAPGVHLERPDIYLGHSGDLNCQCDDILNCCYSCWCFNCAVGSSLEESVGMPCWMGCCCTPFCFARNIQRVHYRIGGTPSACGDCPAACGDCCWDGCIPSLAYCSLCCFPFSLVGFVYLVNFAMDMIKVTHMTCIFPVLQGGLHANFSFVVDRPLTPDRPTAPITFINA